MTTTFVPGNTWVIKIGSSLLTRQGQGITHESVQGWVDDIARIRSNGGYVVLVSSGAVAEGMARLGLTERPRSVHTLQAAAAVGQMGLIQMYESAFQRHDLHTAQILLTHDDLRSRQRYLNARTTLRELLELGVIPVVNENDTVVTDEIQFGDNDTLAALVANLISANTLLLLTDQDGLFTTDPAKDSNAKLVNEMPARDPSLDNMAGEGSRIGRGGMVTKIKAARIAARSGANTVISSGMKEGVIVELSKGIVNGTLLTADVKLLVAKKQWLATLPIKGRLMLDEGACHVLRTDGRSLLAVGVVGSEGLFTRGEMVACINTENTEIARGLINYNSEDTSRLCGVASSDIEETLGYVAEEELIHRDNLVLS